jgi:hypothetical protein
MIWLLFSDGRKIKRYSAKCLYVMNMRRRIHACKVSLCSEYDRGLTFQKHRWMTGEEKS